MRVLRACDVPRVRWRNDGGFTRELHREPVDAAAFHWRVSVAEVETGGAFSTFAGCDRVLVLLEGAGMHLRGADAGRTVTVQPHTPLARFAGDVAVRAALIDGPTTDFNLIWQRVQISANASSCDGCSDALGGGEGEVAGGYVVHGEAQVNGNAVHPGQFFLGEPGDALDLEHNGRMVHFLVGPIGD